MLKHTIEEYCGNMQYSSDPLMKLLESDLKNAVRKVERFEKGESLEEIERELIQEEQPARDQTPKVAELKPTVITNPIEE